MMSTRLVGALVLLLAVYTYALPIQESSHELHETVLLQEDVGLTAMESAYQRAMDAIDKYDASHYQAASRGHDDMKAAMNKAHDAAKKVHDLKEKMKELMAATDAEASKADQDAADAANKKAEVDSKARPTRLQRRLMPRKLVP